jgi:hypothetical protein
MIKFLFIPLIKKLRLIKIILYLLLFIVALGSVNSFASSKGKMSLMDSENHFNNGNYEDAIDVIKSINIHNDLDNSDEIKLALKIKVISYFMIFTTWIQHTYLINLIHHRRW